MRKSRNYSHYKRDEDRILNNISFVTDTECWVWGLRKDKDGYGMFEKNKRDIRAHRFSYYLFHGHWPRICRHICDTPSCVNPHHLLDGTQADNNKDMVDRGRSLKGSRHPSASLTESDVREIKYLLLLGNKNKDIAELFNIKGWTVSKIKLGKAWKHVTITPSRTL